MPDIEEVGYAVTRELDLNLSSFMDDMSSAMDGTPMALADGLRGITKNEFMMSLIISLKLAVNISKLLLKNVWQIGMRY